MATWTTSWRPSSKPWTSCTASPSRTLERFETELQKRPAAPSNKALLVAQRQTTSEVHSLRTSLGIKNGQLNKLEKRSELLREKMLGQDQKLTGLEERLRALLPRLEPVPSVPADETNPKGVEDVVAPETENATHGAQTQDE